MNDKFTIRQLSERAELSRRTIRYCIQKGLIKPPIGRGRRSFYDYNTLEKLREIGRLRAEGKSFTQIREHLKSQIPEEWLIYKIKPWLEIRLRRDPHEPLQKKVEEIAKLISLAEDVLRKE
jgi:DNA-binding transcriptional MerR regulator